MPRCSAELLGEIEHEIVRQTGRMLKTEGFVFVSSPDAVTPYHFDPEHNILLQLVGHKAMTVFPANDARIAPDRVHEAYSTPAAAASSAGATSWSATGKPSRLPRRGDLRAGDGAALRQERPRAVDLAVDHLAQRMELRRSRRTGLQQLLRQLGLDPRPPRRWPARNTGEGDRWRLLRRIPGIR